MKKTSKALIALILIASLTLPTACDDVPTPTPHEHTITKIEERLPTCTENGNKAYYTCSNCGKIFSDENGETEITLSETVYAAKNHSLTKIEANSSTCYLDGNIEYYECSDCGKYYSDEKATKELSKDDTIILGEHDYSMRKEDSISYWYCCSKCKGIQPDSRKPLDPDFVLPDTSTINKTHIIGVGERYDITVSADGDFTPISWDTSIAKVERKFENNISKGFVVYGVGGGSVIISIVSENGETIANHKITVNKDSTTYLGGSTLIKNISVDNADATVYYDDTLVTYTIRTTTGVDKLEFSQLAAKANAIQGGYYYSTFIQTVKERPEAIATLDSLTIDLNSLTDTLIDKEYDTRYSATRTVDGNVATWTVKWDLGATAVKYIQIQAFDSSNGKSQTSYAHLNIVYPKFGGTDKDFETLFDLFIKTNSTVPILFESTKEYNIEDYAVEDFATQYDRFRGFCNFSELFSDTTIYSGIQAMTNYGIATPFSLSDYDPSNFFQGKKVLCQASGLEAGTMGFYNPISNEIRAVWAYLHGYEIDKEKFPYAYDILQKASKIIDEIITDGMTDLEKEIAIYTWIYEWGNALATGELKYEPIPEGLSDYNSQKTAYALLNKYGGDCMAYSATFYMLCNMVGVDCVAVSLSSTTIGGAMEKPYIDHRANVVKLDGEYYFVEAFWSWQKLDSSDGTYRYCNMTTEQAAKIYGWALEENGGPFEFNYTTYLVDEHTGKPLNENK